MCSAVKEGDPKGGFAGPCSTGEFKWRKQVTGTQRPSGAGRGHRSEPGHLQAPFRVLPWTPPRWVEISGTL